MHALAEADQVLLVTQLDLPCLRNVVRLMMSFKESGKFDEKVKIVVNRVGYDTGQISLKKAQETIGRDIFWQVPNDYRVMVEVRNNGVPLMQQAPKAAITQSINQLADRPQRQDRRRDPPKPPPKNAAGAISGPPAAVALVAIRLQSADRHWSLQRPIGPAHAACQCALARRSIRYNPHDRPICRRNLSWPLAVPPLRTPGKLSFHASNSPIPGAHRAPPRNRTDQHHDRLGTTSMTKLANSPAALSQKDKEAEFENIKRRIHTKLVDKLDLSRVGELEGDVLRREIRLVVEHLCDTEDTFLNRNERDRLIDEVLDETFGLGPLEMLLKEPIDQRNHDQRPEERVRRTQRHAGKDRRSRSATTST